MERLFKCKSRRRHEEFFRIYETSSSHEYLPQKHIPFLNCIICFVKICLVCSNRNVGQCSKHIKFMHKRTNLTLTTNFLIHVSPTSSSTAFHSTATTTKTWNNGLAFSSPLHFVKHTKKQAINNNKKAFNEHDMIEKAWRRILIFSGSLRNT